MLNHSHQAAGVSPLVVSVLLLNISCEKCIAFTNRGVGEVEYVGGTVGAAAKGDQKKKTQKKNTPFFLGS